MGRPPFTSGRQIGTELVSAYIEHIGSRELHQQDHGLLRRIDALLASYLIGRGCFLLIAGDDRPADCILRSVRDTLRPIQQSKRRNFNQRASYGAHLFHLATMLLDRNDGSAAEMFQTVTHQQAIRDLKRVGHNFESSSIGRRIDLAGRRTEQLLLALLTRHQGIGTLTVQALVHHDRGERRTNYDLLVVDAGGRHTQAAPHEVQLKNPCLNFCHNNQGAPAGQAVCAGYSKDITLISGHCDVHRGKARVLASWLVDEQAGNASPEVITTLDTRTLNLFETLVAPEPWRMGGLSVE